MYEYTQTGPGSIKHQSSLTGKIVGCDNNYYSFTLNPSFVIDAMWEIPKAELRHGAEIAKGQCGVSIIEATLRFAFAFSSHFIAAIVSNPLDT